MKLRFLAAMVALAIFSHPQILFSQNGNIDTDGDGLTEIEEVSVYYTNPNNADTDGDGFLDGQEIKDGFSPLNTTKTKMRAIDTDKDGLWDDWEIILGTSLVNPDTDTDGFLDGPEVMAGHDPLSFNKQLIPKRIEVSLKDQKLAYFFGDKKLDEFAISSGLRGTPTPPGEYTVLKKRPVVWYRGADYNFPNTKWNLMFKPGTSGNYYIHGAYWHNQFGKPRSHGCVNVPHKAEYMGRLYDWANEGTPISIRAS